MTQDPLQAAKTPDTRSPLLRPNLFTGVIGARDRVHHRRLDRPPRRRPPRLGLGNRPERRVGAPRLQPRHDRLHRRPGAARLPVPSPAGATAGGRRQEGHRRLALPDGQHRPQGDRHAVPVGDRRVLLHRRPERDADPHQPAAPEPADILARSVPDDRRPARLDDGDDGVEHHPGAVRALPGAAHDRRAADGVPAHRGAHVLADAAVGRGADVGHQLRRLPDRLDRLPAARAAGQRRHGRLHLRLLPGGRGDDPERDQPDGHDHHHARAGADLEPAADLRLEHAGDHRADAAGRAGAGGAAC